MVKQKKRNVRKRIINGLILLVLLGMSFIFLFPSSKYHIGNNVTGTIKVTVNGNSVMPENISCVSDTERIEKVNMREKQDCIEVKCKAFQYNAYYFDYDVQTEDGTKHFRFMVFKTHNGGPVVDFCYEMKLKNKSGEWIAEVLLVEKDAEGMIQKIPLKEDSVAYVQLGP